MDLVNKLTFLLMIFAINTFAKNSFDRCTRRVTKCPLTRDLWYQRMSGFPCFGEGLNYTCMMATNGVLVEACINEYDIRAYSGRCPYIIACDGLEPVLAIEVNWPLCPEDVIGCPPAEHPTYTVYHMYQYPACIVTNVTELLTTTLQEDMVTSSSLVINRTTTTKSNDEPIIRIPPGIIAGTTFGVVLVPSLIIAIYVWKVCRSRKVKTKEVGTELYDIEDRLSGKLEPLLNESSDACTCDEETDLKYQQNPCDSDDKNNSAHLTTDEGYYISLRKRLLELSDRVTEKIPISPLQTYGNLPVELLYTKVVINTDEKYVKMGRQYFKESYKEKKPKTVENPRDLFYKIGKPTKRMFLSGNAAHGKTMFCLWLLQHWYMHHAQIIRTRTDHEQDEWREMVGIFDFAFLIRLRDIQKLTATIIDMICKDILKIDDKEYIKWLKNALKSGQYRCLILIDGLDEWKPDDNVTEDARFKGIPITDDIENCVILFTMRPWKLEEISNEVNPEDRVLKILGLNEDGKRILMENVLFNHYELNINTPAGELKYDTIMNKLKDTTLASVMKIPLLAVLCVQIWYTGDDIGNSLTKFYTAMVDILIDRVMDPNKTKDKYEGSPTSSQKYQFISKKLGKLAYKGLMTGEYIFVFPAEEMLGDIDLTRPELDFSLHVGLISREETDSIMTKKVKIYFLHTSLQEYLAAKYIVENEEIRDSFCKQLSSIKDILEFDNVLVFLSGLDRELGSDLSKRIVDVAKEDIELKTYRKFNSAFPLYQNKKVDLVYELQVRCYREFVYNQSCKNKSSQSIPYHVSDVHVNDKSDMETISTTSDILANHHADITSLYMNDISDNVEYGIPDSLLTQHLEHTESLQSLYIFNGYNRKRTFHINSDIFSALTALILYNVAITPDAVSTLQTALQSNTVIQTLGMVDIKFQVNENEGHERASLCGILQILPDLSSLTTLHIGIGNDYDKPVFLDVLSRLSHLHGIFYFGTLPSDDEYDRDVIRTMCTWSRLRWVRLSLVNLGDSGLKLPHDMLHIEIVWMFKVDMSPTAMNNFIHSLLNINHEFDVTLDDVNIDEESLALIRSSQLVKIKREKLISYDRYDLQFTKVCPLA